VAGAEPTHQPTATIFGVSLGTGVVGIASALPVQWEPLKALLVYAAPALTIGVRFAWLWIADWSLTEGHKRYLDQAIREAEAHCARIRANPAASHAHKEEMQSTLESLEKVRMMVITNRSERVGVQLQEVRAAAERVARAGNGSSGNGDS